MKRMAFVLNALLLSALAAAAQPAVPATAGPVIASKDAMSASINAVPCDQDKRLEGVRALFAAAGAAEGDIKIEKFDKNKTSNLVVKKPGKTAETVVIGAHYDKTSDGCGVTDNWAGITILAHLYGTMAPLTTEKSYVFVAFDREEEGLKGSHAMLKAMADTDREQICSMVNFDSFGQGAPMALKNASSDKMLGLAEELAKQNQMKFVSVAITGASSDSQAFRDKKIPAITLSGLSSNWQTILHSSNDKLDKVNIDSVYLGYRFGLLYLSKLDVGGCRDFR